MEKQRGTTIAIVAALIVAVISLGVAFAAFSTTLNINGTATVQASSWKIYFSNSNTANSEPSSSTAIADITESNTQGLPETATGTGSMTATEVTWNATFKTAGDKVVYKFYVRNDGAFDAKVSNTPAATAAGGSGITCTKGGSAEVDVCSHIHYGLYTDAAGTTPVAQNLTLAHNSYDEYYLIAWLDTSYGGNDGTGLADGDVTTATITTTVTYSQADIN